MIAHFIFRGQPPLARYFLWTRKSLGSRESYNFVASGTFLDEKLIFMDYDDVLRTYRTDFAKYLLSYKIQPIEFLWTNFSVFALITNYGTAGARTARQTPQRSCYARLGGCCPTQSEFY